MSGAKRRDGGAPPVQPGRVLIVEDDYLVGIELEAALTEAGFESLGIAVTADGAVRLATSLRPDLIVMDIRLAGKADGVDAALEIFHSCGIRCIFATANQDAETRQRAAPAGPLGWLAKPYRATTLIAMIRAALVQLGPETKAGEGGLA